MQTLRKLPTHSPSSTTPTTMTISVPTQDLIEQDPRRYGDVERLCAARQWNRDALSRDRIELRADSRSFVADDHRNELLGRRPGIERAGERHAVRRGRPQCDAAVPRPGDERAIVELHDGVPEGRPHRRAQRFRV